MQELNDDELKQAMRMMSKMEVSRTHFIGSSPMTATTCTARVPFQGAVQDDARDTSLPDFVDAPSPSW